MTAFHLNFSVSIQCMTYNHAPYIEKTLDGFCMQKTTFPYVAIIVDDASTDGEPDKIHHYINTYFDMSKAEIWETDDAHFIYVRHQDNLNCFFAIILLKYNFWQAKKDKAPLYDKFEEDAKYIAICEGDDYWIDENKLQRQFDFLEDHPKYSICSHDFFYFEQDKEMFRENSAYRAFFLSQSFTKGYFEYSLDNYFEGWWAHPLSCMYRNGSYLKEIPIQKYHHYRDDIFFYYVLKTGKGALLDAIMGVYRLHNGGTWSIHTNVDRIKMAINNAYNIYVVEKDERAFACIIHNQYKLILYLKKYGKISEAIGDVILFYKMDPIKYFSKLVYNILKYDIWMLKKRIVKLLKGLIQ